MDRVKEEAAATYQVFINHRGPDVKLTLASLIYYRLTSCGLRVFLDTEELCTGHTLCPAIVRAIHSASVHIVIFSENYAESRWCLDELCWILRSSRERTIIPVFFDVGPVDLRYVYKGRYAQAFQKHQLKGRVDTEVIDGWKAALKEAADISGLLFKKNESDHGKFLEIIVEKVLKVVKWEPLEVATYPVGLDQASEDLQNEIKKQSGTKVVGISGLGGIGKSTLAKHIFNLKRLDFTRSCYLSNVREKVDLTSLQRQLLCDLLGIDVNIANTDLGKSILRNSLGGLKILIVLDDVDDKEKIKNLLDMDAVGTGSVIIITSRDKDIVIHSSANISTLLYDVKPMKRKHAQELFCRHAFLQSKPFEGYEDLVEEFLEICGGLPLCIKVLGEQLAGKLDRTYWKGQLEKFSQGLPLPEADAVLKSLKLSYQALDTEEKELFLDIGCFLVGEDEELAVHVLEGLGYYKDVRNCLESLRQKCLLDFQQSPHKIDNLGEVDVTGYKYSHRYDNNLFRLGFHLPAALTQANPKIVMQNQVRELVRHIVREESRSMDKPLRLCSSTDIVKMLQFQGGSDQICPIRGLRIPKGDNPPQFTNNINIRGVRLLVVEHPIDLSSVFGRRGISGDLVWLRLHNSRFISFPSSISLRSLRVLELRGIEDDLFSKIDEVPSQLRELNIDGRGGEFANNSINGRNNNICSTHLGVMPSVSNWSITQQCAMPSFSRFLQLVGTLMANLTKIVLKNLEFLQSLPINFSDLKNLRHLDLSGSTHLTELPNSFSQLLQLQYLALRGCENLSLPTDILGEISTLEYVDFKGCVKLVQLPGGMASQRSLRCLNLLDTNLVQLPENLELLDKLERLRIGSVSLTELPHSVGSLMQLKELILFECPNLKRISTLIEKLTRLERLEIYDSKVPILPAGIALLRHMRILALYNCPIADIGFQQKGNYVDDGAMDILRDFTLRRASISKICIPECVCPRLEVVDLSYNFKLMEVQGFPSTLLKLKLEGCLKLKTLINLSNLVHLKFLNINGCVELETLNVEGLRSMEEIKAEQCWKLQNIHALSKLERVNHLHISTHNGVVSNGISDFFASRSQLSTAIFSAKIQEDMNFEKVTSSILSSFEHRRVVDVRTTATATYPVLLNDVHSYKGLLMCFVTTNVVHCNSFNISFEASNNRAQPKVYETSRGDLQGERRLRLYEISHGHLHGGWRFHMYMWTEDSTLFKDENFYNKVAVYHKINGNGRAQVDAGNGEKGWIITFETKTEGLEICRQVMVEIKSMECTINWQVTS